MTIKAQTSILKPHWTIQIHITTRKLCYRKDNRAIRRVPWKFSGLPDYAHSYYSQHFSRAFVRIDPLNVPTKFEVVALSVPGIIGGTQKFGQSLDTRTLPFLENF